MKIRFKKVYKKFGKYLIPMAGIITGLVILSLPFIENAANEKRNEGAISSMISEYSKYEENGEEIERQLEEAARYNEKLALTFDGEVLPYEEQLNFDGNGIMGYIEIPEINVKMLIYHGTSDEVLVAGAGHLESSSLPIGGSSTHAVITAHSGLREMRGFDDLRKLEEGDGFSITVLGKTIDYVVESVETVLPYETESLAIIKGEDRCTLVTCTPYGINDHRLLVHGIRNVE